MYSSKQKQNNIYSWKCCKYGYSMIVLVIITELIFSMIIADHDGCMDIQRSYRRSLRILLDHGLYPTQNYRDRCSANLSSGLFWLSQLLICLSVSFKFGSSVPIQINLVHLIWFNFPQDLSLCRSAQKDPITTDEFSPLRFKLRTSDCHFICIMYTLLVKWVYTILYAYLWIEVLMSQNGI